MNADSCPFRHGYDENKLATRLRSSEPNRIGNAVPTNNPEEEEDTFNLDPQSFPALGSRSSVKAEKETPNSLWTQKPLQKSPPKWGSPQPPSYFAQQHQDRVSEVVAPTMPKLRIRKQQKSEPKVNVEWAETGDVVGEQYQALREEAVQHARLRNRLFHEATQAYLSGNKSAATELSSRGRHHDHRMKELHARAAREIFQSRNAKYSKTNIVDLHGLHVQEALPLMQGFLDRLDTSRFTDAYIITGTGHHTNLHLSPARLLRTVKQYFTERGYTFSEVLQSNGKGGMIRVVVDGGT